MQSSESQTSKPTAVLKCYLFVSVSLYILIPTSLLQILFSMSLSFALFETKCFSCHFVTAQIAHGPSTVAILAHHNKPQSRGLRFGLFCY